MKNLKNSIKFVAVSFYTYVYSLSMMVINLCRDPGLNWGPIPLQGSALPTELSRHNTINQINVMTNDPLGNIQNTFLNQFKPAPKN
jgi:hypothetical protein